MQNSFNENYFERGIATGLSLYTDYRWIPELTIPMCYEMVRLCAIEQHEMILDFGCSKGFVVKGFRLLGFDAFGVDISEYAINHAPEDVKEFLTLVKPGQTLPLPPKPRTKWDWIIAKDVLEHIEQSELSSVVKHLRDAGQNAYIIVPLGDGTKYNISSYEMDVTHKVRQPIEWWHDLFTSSGWHISFYHTKHGFIKKNWAGTPNGNGFFILS
jgi:SAM-dependent methyltransferase